WMKIQMDVQTEIGHPPAPGASVLQALSLSEPNALAAALSATAFREVRTSTVATPRAYASLDETLEAMQSTSPAQSALMQQLTSDERERYLSALKRHLADYADAAGAVAVPGEALLAVGTR